MSQPPALPLELAFGPFSVGDARSAGIPAARLRRGDLDSPFRGVRSSTPAQGMLDRCAAYATILRPGVAFSGVSAAILWGMWIPSRFDRAPVDIVAVGANRPPRMLGVGAHHARAAKLALVHGMPVTSPTSTWRALALVLSLDELIAAGDSLLRRTGALCTLGELSAPVPAARGAALVARALPQVRARCDSPKETDLRLLLVRAGLPEPEVNPEVSEPGARTRFGDLVFWQWRVIAEYDGAQHRLSARQFAEDVRRLEELARAGWTVIRVLASDFDEPEGIVARVAQALRDRGWRGRVSRSQLWRRPTASG